MKSLELDAQIGSYVEVPDFLNMVTAGQLITTGGTPRQSL
jgi:hypothetical protein